MVHGFRGTHEGLDLISKELEQNFYIIVPDLPGFGDSVEFIGKPHSLDSYTVFLKEFIQSLNLPAKPVLLGHSFGSLIVSHYAAAHQDTITKLILINPIASPALEGSKATLSKLALLYYKIGAKLPGKAGQAWLSAKPMVWAMSKSMTKTKDEQLVAYIDDQHYTHFSRFRTKGSVLEAFETSISHTVGEFAKRITIPVLMIIGNKDDIGPLESQFELSKLFKRAEIQIIKDVGHLIHYEAPQKAAGYIERFSR